MRRGDPDDWDWTEPRPLPDPQQPVVVPRERSPFSPSLGTKLVAIFAFLLIIPSGLLYSLRYELGLSDGSYRFIALQPGADDVPVTYESCQPISYVVNDRRSIAGGQQLIDEAVARISAATGLRFRTLGSVTQVPGRNLTAGTTVVITWTDAMESPELEGDTVAVGGSSYARLDEKRFFSGGRIDLDAPDLAEMLERHGPENVRAVVMHELGHVVGLDHVEDRNELMNERNVGMTDFGPGDLRGLAVLGKGGCATGE